MRCSLGWHTSYAIAYKLRITYSTIRYLRDQRKMIRSQGYHSDNFPINIINFNLKVELPYSFNNGVKPMYYKYFKGHNNCDNK